MLETNLDDLPAEVIGYCYDLLLAAGALDVFSTPIYMKKNRPGVLLSVLATEPALAARGRDPVPRDDDPGRPPLSGDAEQAPSPRPAR